jgi:SAM-dependent methyltransferase
MDELKQRHRAMWASGDYPSIATVVAPVSEELVRAVDLGPGKRVLDVAAGTGSSAIPAAATGAEVIASDLTPEFFDIGRERASAEGVELEWMQADAEDLPFEDASFDVVLSAIGVMFAPHHEAAAGELLRVTKPGGTIGLACWTPEGVIGEVFKVMKPYAPPPPPGAQPPPLWGDEAHVRELLGERVETVDARRQTVTVDHFETPEDLRDYFKTTYGPTIAVYRAISDDPGKVAGLDRDLADLARRFDRGTTSTVLDWEYLLVVARRTS